MRFDGPPRASTLSVTDYWRFRRDSSVCSAQHRCKQQYGAERSDRAAEQPDAGGAKPISEEHRDAEEHGNHERDEDVTGYRHQNEGRGEEGEETDHPPLADNPLLGH